MSYRFVIIEAMIEILILALPILVMDNFAGKAKEEIDFAAELDCC